ncbi:UNVERIFIED_CONTAM: Heptahelical transmembrane protein 1 [Sesamum angustifolium]|uniref:Heptahelical transmembrane protein 1 n=1 Tax=Sesamum angustifolium TaxID=2727405 RepID=A0AAW2PTS1_9LAMI
MTTYSTIRVNWAAKVALAASFNATMRPLTSGPNVAHVPQVADFITMFSGQLPSSAEGNVSSKFSLGTVKLMDLWQKSSPETGINAEKRPPQTGHFMCSLRLHVLSPLKQHVPSLLLPLPSLKRIPTPAGLRRDHSHDNHLLLPSNILHLPVHPTLADCLSHWYHNHRNMHCRHIALSSPHVWEIPFIPCFAFVCMAVGLIPAVHALVANWNDPYRNITLAYESAMALFYLIGTLFYVSRVPERWKPGWFDLVGQSHQFFHVFVVLGALAHYGAAQIFLRCRSRMGCNN